MQCNKLETRTVRHSTDNTIRANINKCGKQKVTKSAIAFHLYLQERLIVINSQLAKDLQKRRESNMQKL